MDIEDSKKYGLQDGRGSCFDILSSSGFTHLSGTLFAFAFPYSRFVTAWNDTCAQKTICECVCLVAWLRSSNILLRVVVLHLIGVILWR